jgi:GR25 family glycosyltransferase involved in LPS biosynthesis
MLNVNKVYIAHYSPLSARKEFLSKQLEYNNIFASWIENEPSEEEVKMLSSSNDWYNKFDEMNNINFHEKRELKKSEFSLCYKHLKIYEDILKNNVKTSLILEDDVIFEKDFNNKFNVFLSMTPKDWDFIFIGDGCNLHVPVSLKKEGVVAYKKEHPASKCTDSYIVKKASIEKIMSTIIPFSFPIDFELNYQMFKHNLNVYWWEPTIISQGSQCGIYKSEIQ